MSDSYPTAEALTLRRRYKPSEIWGRKLNLNKFENYEVDSSFAIAPTEKDTELCLCCGRHITSGNAILLAIDGACRGNGRSPAVVSFGIFNNVGSDFNLAGTLDMQKLLPATNQRAELLAAINAVSNFLIIYSCNLSETASRAKQIILKSDSAYLVNGITSHINKWRTNGFVSSTKRKPTFNGDLFERLDNLIFKLNELGCQVRFWHVRREHNVPADNLANAALDGRDWEQFGKDELFVGGCIPFQLRSSRSYQCPMVHNINSFHAAQ